MAANSISEASIQYANQIYGARSIQAAQQTQKSEGDAAASAQSAAVSLQQADRVNVKASVAAKNLDTVRTIEMMHARLNEQAKKVRETNEALAQASEMMDKIKEPLRAVMKNFPPFPLDDRQRQELLMSYSGIRKEIERLMVPSPPVPLYDKVKKMWEDMFAQNGQILPSAVPALTPSSTDGEVKQAASQLDKTADAITLLSNSVTESFVKP